MPTFTRTGPDGTLTRVAGEPWFWVAHYGPGEHLAQFDARDGTFHRFGEIDRERLTTFALAHRDDAARRFEVPMKPWMRPIHAYRNVVLNANTLREVRIRTYLFGYQETVEGRNVKHLVQVWPDGRTVLVRG